MMVAVDIPTVQVSLDLYWLNLIAAVFLPALVALVTKRLASSGWKSIVLLASTAVGATLTEIIAHDGTFDLVRTIGTMILMFVVSVASHYGLLEPLKVTGKDGAIQKAIPGGVGGASTP